MDLRNKCLVLSCLVSVKKNILTDLHSTHPEHSLFTILIETVKYFSIYIDLYSVDKHSHFTSKIHINTSSLVKMTGETDC